MGRSAVWIVMLPDHTHLRFGFSVSVYENKWKKQQFSCFGSISLSDILLAARLDSYKLIAHFMRLTAYH